MASTYRNKKIATKSKNYKSINETSTELWKHALEIGFVTGKKPDELGRLIGKGKLDCYIKFYENCLDINVKHEFSETMKILVNTFIKNNRIDHIIKAKLDQLILNFKNLELIKQKQKLESNIQNNNSILLIDNTSFPNNNYLSNPFSNSNNFTNPFYLNDKFKEDSSVKNNNEDISQLNNISLNLLPTFLQTSPSVQNSSINNTNNLSHNNNSNNNASNNINNSNNNASNNRNNNNSINNTNNLSHNSNNRNTNNNNTSNNKNSNNTNNSNKNIENNLKNQISNLESKFDINWNFNINKFKDLSSRNSYKDLWNCACEIGLLNNQAYIQEFSEIVNSKNIFHYIGNFLDKKSDINITNDFLYKYEYFSLSLKNYTNLFSEAISLGLLSMSNIPDLYLKIPRNKFVEYISKYKIYISDRKDILIEFQREIIEHLMNKICQVKSK